MIIDSNILNEIVETKSGNIVDVLMSWICDITDEIKDHVKGKKITFFVSQEIIKEYETSLSREDNEGVRKEFRQTINRHRGRLNHIPDRNNISMTITKKEIPHSNRKKIISDKDDEKFLLLAKKILEVNDWRDRAIIFASKDRKSMPQIQKALILHRREIEFAEDMQTLVKTIQC